MGVPHCRIGGDSGRACGVIDSAETAVRIAIQSILAAIGALDVTAIAPELRAELARAWADDALAEHASIASFARFSLELLALGAPPELVAGAHEAALDEIDHARGSFAAASRFAGSPLGPGPLAPDAINLASVEVSALVSAATREGCVGETAAAVIAAAERDACTVAPLRDLLALIARDEARHACLAWRFVAWAISEYGEPARRAFERALGAPASEIPQGVHEPLTAPFGRLGAARRDYIAARVHAKVVVARAALLAEPAHAVEILVEECR